MEAETTMGAEGGGKEREDAVGMEVRRRGIEGGRDKGERGGKEKAKRSKGRVKDNMTTGET